MCIGSMLLGNAIGGALGGGIPGAFAASQMFGKKKPDQPPPVTQPGFGG